MLVTIAPFREVILILYIENQNFVNFRIAQALSSVEAAQGLVGAAHGLGAVITVLRADRQIDGRPSRRQNFQIPVPLGSCHKIRRVQFRVRSHHKRPGFPAAGHPVQIDLSGVNVVMGQKIL